MAEENTKIRSETARVVGGFQESLIDNILFPFMDAGTSILNMKKRMWGMDEIEGLEEQDKQEIKKEIIKKTVQTPGLSAISSLMGGVTEEEVFTEEGDVKEPETIPGMIADVAAEIGTYAIPYAGTTKVLKGLGAVKSKVVVPTAGVVVSEQLLTDPQQNLFNALKDIFPESSQDTLIEYLAADPNDSEAHNRMKMLVQDVGLVPLIERGFSGVGKIAEIVRAKKAQRLSSVGAKMVEDPKKLSLEEENEIAMSVLKEAKDILRFGESEVVERTDLPSMKEALKETDEGIKQVQKQSKTLNKYVNRFFTSRGFYTKKAYNAFRDSQYAQRQTIAAAENIGNRLTLALKNITDVTESSQMSERAQGALTTNADFIYDLKPEDRLEAATKFYADNFDLTEDVASEIANARLLIDDLSTKIINSKGFSDEAKESIEQNLGSYLRRSYRAYEDPNYRPTTQARKNAVDFLADDIMEQNPEIDINEAFTKAKDQVDKLLGKSDSKEVVDYLAQVQRVSKFRKKKDIPEPIRALLGEIKEPGENIILSISKASRINEVNRFYRQFNEIGKSGKYLFTKEAKKRGEVPDNYVPITGTNSVLDGKYTTPELLESLQRTDEKFTWYRTSNFWKTTANLKGISQQQQTVFNHVTHLRNFLGGTQFAIANGLNPFSKASLQSVKTLFNQLSKKGDKELNEEYEKYLRLGLVNTSVRVNEFRKLLDTGFEDNPSKMMQKLASLKYGDSKIVREGAKGAGKIADTLENVYMATDDFFKITAYHKELKTLKKAFPNQREDVLEVQAARIIQDTLPNYDKVPKGIKALRDLPVGNFISFPSEIARTSINIIRQASNEITSGNSTLRNRGLQRLAGFTTTSVGFTAASKESMDALGWTEEEQKAHEVLAEGSFNEDSDKLWKRSDDGELFFVDTRFLDSYEFIKRPVMIAYDRIATGQLRGDELKSYLTDAFLDSTFALLEPYASGEMITEAVFSTGKKLYNDQIGFEEAFIDVVQPFIPGGFKSFYKFLESEGQIFERVGDYNGKPRDTQAELIANMTGVRFTRYEPEQNFKFAIRDYKIAESDAQKLGKFTYNTDTGEYSKKYRENQEDLYVAQQELFEKYLAYSTLFGGNEARDILKEGQVRADVISGLSIGQFTPTNISSKLTVDAYNTLYAKDPELARELLNEFTDEMHQIKSSLNGSSLYKPEFKYDVKTKKFREEFKKGGEVFNVPSVPTEPDQRIDKMTGMPYDQQAGTAFVDAEDPLRRMGFVGGGLGKLLTGGKKIAEAVTDKEDLSARSRLIKDDKSVDEILNLDEKLIKEWRDQQKGAKFDRIPEVKEAADKFAEDPEFTEEMYDEIVRQYQPVKALTEVPKMPTKEEVAKAIKSNQRAEGILGVNLTIPDGSKTATRLDISAYENYDTWVVSLHDGPSGKSIGYGQTAVLNNVEFKSTPRLALNIARDRQNKSTIARMYGDWENRDPEEVKELATKLIGDPEWTQIGVNPFRHSFFYDKETMQPVVSADQVIQVGPLVLAKNAKVTSRKDPRFAINKRLQAEVDKGLLDPKFSKKFNEGGKVLQALRRTSV